MEKESSCREEGGRKGGRHGLKIGRGEMKAEEEKRFCSFSKKKHNKTDKWVSWVGEGRLL